jgi:hypothetical protein
VATARDDVDEIRRAMAQIRRELHEDMQGVVAGAEAASDWRYYVRRYPWVALGAAAALGFLVVPKRKRSAAEVAEKAATEAVHQTAGRLSGLLRRTRHEAAKVAEGAKDVAEGREPESVEKKKAKSGLMGMLFGMITPIAMRAAQNYAMHFVENWITQQQQAAGLGPMAAGGPPPGFGPFGGFGAPPGGGPRPGPAAGPGPAPGRSAPGGPGHPA